ncbi:GTPase Era [Aneurinibacillus aneurinilyticus]|jgi:GTP-binding protein Era|uniref:GTPase Era n=2 Tax=Aneurinibacillus aneurinilyticus TaxID=1391 RepID=A0A848CSY7_ANEAE|nr:GTPase Era [Aneurinibacillus aneurinilyticus]ERI09912.1 ribosome biogenesis GTPase Era [Aneurinibacillus aneurinilyticus ATCC 12856]MCI1695442.1 GTPase Era [Aneurinibacillus aneurinilyticus]MED0673234.1 GTPase Era [Aneurinibacillus aneurinilyticus]MED0706751.1 GTPase Era [Aneurinibacillus aneurinilyticus]MED0725714.1 GTPase Era [Aneurinibacillus aneurinilyticus]
MDNKGYKSGFVAIVGRPNVGKSTLMNYIVGQKVAIMSDKPQTTRNKIRAVYTSEEGQIIFLDTPGVHKPKSKLGNYMNRMVENALREVDVVLFLVDASEKLGPGDEYIIEKLKEVKTPVYLVINKIDKVHPEELLPFIDQYKELYAFEEIVPVSALQGNNVNRLMEQLLAKLPEGPQYYPEDQITDHPERFVVAELIREKILHLTREEVPHSIAVVIEQMKPREDNEHLIDIYATIYTERPTQKGILVGKQGSMMKEIGMRAREDIERLLGTKVYLNLWIKVKKDWRNQENMFKNFGFYDEE